MPSCKFTYICCEKSGNQELENEDAYLIPGGLEIENEKILKFSVSDGATESSFSKEWADLLVTYFKGYSFEDSNLNNTLDLVRDSWLDKIKKIELPWYAEEKVQSGAHASLLGLTLNLEQLTWHAVAIGDSNLFHIRGAQLLKSFPINNVEGFGNTPYLLASKPTQNTDINSHISRDSASIEIGDTLILSTDAIAAWILSEAQKNNEPWINLSNLIGGQGFSKTDFKNWLNNKRIEREIKNDDTTLIIIEIT